MVRRERVRRRVLEAAEREHDPDVGEEEQQDQADPKGRHVVEEQARQDYAALDAPPPLPRDVAADKDADNILDEYGPSEQEQGPWQGILYCVDKRAARVGGPAEGEGEHVDDVPIQLDLRALVEPILPF